MAPKNIAVSKPRSSSSRRPSKPGRQAEKPLGYRPEVVKKVTSSATRTSWASLSPEEVSRAQALANITMNYQRPDKDLIEAMKNKQQHVVAAAIHDLPSIESSALPPTVADENTMPENDVHPTPTSPASHGCAPHSRRSKRYSDWEDKARQIIEREELSLDREWSRLSWKQKASNIVRLKLLKDDGYDVSPLMEKGTTSDQIIDALLAHIEARKQPSPSLSTLGSEGESKPDFSTESDASSLDTRISTSHKILKDKFNPPSARPSLDSSGAKWPLLAPPPGNRFYDTSPIITQKRKHSHEDDPQPPWHETNPKIRLHTLYNQSLTANSPKEPPCACGISPQKILRLLSPALVSLEIQDQAFALLKWRICRSLFRSSRDAQTTFHIYTTTKYIPSKKDSCLILVRNRTPAPKPSRILFMQHASPATQPSGSNVYIGSRAFAIIKREVQCLSWSYDAQDGSYCIQDHDAEDTEAEANTEQTFQHDIRMSGPRDDYAAVIEGQPRALASLMKYLRTHELFHLGQWRVGDVRGDAEGERDVQMRVVVNEGLPMQLSHRTDRALEEIERRLLGERGDVGGDEVRVGIV